ncbi:LOW QUALITY PROTEIN: uncharacterized protein LOC118326538 [Morone saxatilis]|uniref:LOW QUALITY PROTEIN: uncharacterized protein LOC118326538 n=1 Tax=Morone saxatilis TaxID=34816 RepID=UPI0015E1DFA1|nr:LOW QUALITY PROTEIN: uncharacterized protein LOC118326538 [Morone saxatilis]
MTSVLGIALLALALLGPTVAFVPIGGGASTHISITGTALLQKVTETCRAVAEAAGHEFNPTGSSPEELVQACLGPTATGEVSGAKFHSALQEIYTQNGLVDRDFVNSAPHHFNSEAFLEGRGLIREGMAAIKANIGKENFQAARETLGRVLHTLQDFYSHTNWVELGYTEPYINLIRPDLPLENLADINTATCSDCASGKCPNPILPNILKEKKLTSGYMGIFSAAKPKVQTLSPCLSWHQSKDSVVDTEKKSRPLMLHALFLSHRMMGIARSSVVCFVIDTTGSMSDDIDEARAVVYEIIDSKKGTQDEPSEYILVPFNDPMFGPMIRTTDPDKMKSEISKLTASGGGDTPEMCLSGLQLALTGAPASSHIYVFTDAIAKDIDLKDTIVALIRSSKSTVSFFVTGPFSVQGTLGSRNLPLPYWDETLEKYHIYITGTSITFTLTKPCRSTGKLGTIQTVGNLRRIRLNADKQTGTWQINIKSNQPYTLKVTAVEQNAKSIITFIYNFVKASEDLTQVMQYSVGVHNKYLVLRLIAIAQQVTWANGDILVTVDEVPGGEFVVILRGTDKRVNNRFQRQSTTQMSVSKVNIQAVVDSSVEPGKAFQLPFSVMTQGSGGKYSIGARNDRNFLMSFPNSLTLTAGQYANATLTITPPANTPSGTDVTLTIEAKSSSGADSNYIVLRFSVVTKITDFVQPLCEVVSVLANDCPQDVSQCGPFRWELSANLTDGNGTGIETISLRQGNGTLLHSSLSNPVVRANYTSSCCSQIVEFIAVDKVGNVGKCYHSIVRSAGPPALTLSLPLWLCLLVSAFVARG